MVVEVNKMAKIYALSDIHGCLAPLKEALSQIRLQAEDQVLFLGDYVDRGQHSYQVLQTIMDFETRYPGQVTVLLGNHDEWLCEWLFYSTKKFVGYGLNMGLVTIESFFDESKLQAILNSQTDAPTIHARLAAVEEALRAAILVEPRHQALLAWLKRKYQLPRYVETNTQIFVHAGVDEETGEHWRLFTPDEIYTCKYPFTTGEFYKTIICGHFHSSLVADDEEYLGRVYYDQASHYFIDGYVNKSGTIPILVYDTQTQRYTALEKIADRWQEVVLDK
ncbi:hypothetical protein RR47_GL000469 [Enterococcus columbae DSM 7374 = ATCC 51263]|nr:hypothetical protein RR47_GL000469 [Enterococcus columbae DSM 7374 = ATCC 51263]